MPDFVLTGGQYHSEMHYVPVTWEMAYQASPYLKRSSDSDICLRYASIVRGIEVLVDDGRNRIPISSFLSSWYWFKKEHECRLELHQRKLAIPGDPLTIAPGRRRLGAPLRTIRPNSGALLFRFTYQTKARELVDTGVMRLRCAEDYAKGAATDPRTDLEQEKSALLAGERVRVSTMDGRSIDVKGDPRRTVSFPTYYLASFACDYSSLMISEFGYDSYVLIRDGDEFCRRFELAAKRQAARFIAHHNPIEYFDPFDHTLESHIDPAMSKDFRFAWQSEYRFLLMPDEPGKHVPLPHVDLELGPLNDIAEVRLA
jgi:hypothetical protein